MTMLVIGLYDSSNDANDSIDLLKDEGFSKSNIELIEYSEKKEEHGFFKSLFNTGGGKDLSADDLAEMGVPQNDARFYTDAVHDGRSLLIVQCDDDQTAKARSILAGTNLSDYGIPPSRRGSDEAAASSGFVSTGEPAGSRHFTTEDDITAGQSSQTSSSEDLPKFEKVEEELHVGKREVETGGVRVSSKIREEEVEEDIELREEKIDVQRRDVDRPVEAGESAFQEETLEFTETREEPMIEKEARVTEEVIIGKEVDTETETVRETLRHKDIEVENLYSLANRDTGRFEQYESQFRSHYDENYGAKLGSDADDRYDEFSMGYRYGMALAEHEPLREESWEQVEPKARQGWEAHNAGTWNEYRDSVRYGWLRIRGDEEERALPSEGL